MPSRVSNSHLSSLVRRASARLRDAIRRRRTSGGTRVNLPAWTAAALLGALLAGGVSWVAVANEPGPKNDRPAGAAAAKPTKPAAAPAAKRPAAHASPAPAPAPAPTPARPSPQNEVSDATQTPQDQNGAQVSPDLLRQREEWFYQQRSYPIGHIPSGARQAAVEHRKAMEVRQLEAAGAAQAAPGAEAAALAPLANLPIVVPGPASWTPIGPQPLNPSAFTGANFGNPSASGRVLSIAVDPSAPTTTWYLAAALGGVWKTTNAGTTWTPMTDSQPSLSMGAVEVSPVAGHNNIIYAATGEQNSFGFDNYYGAGVLKSTNGGTTWTQTGTPPGAPFKGPFGLTGSGFSNAFSSFFGGAHIGSVAINPANDNLVLVAVQFGGSTALLLDPPSHPSGVYCTNDGGTTWSQIASATSTMASFVGYANSTTAYAGIGFPFGGDGNNGIYVSTNADGGVSKSCSAINFTVSSGTGLPAQARMGRIILAPATADATGKTAYAAIADTNTGSNTLLSFLKTVDGGLNWTTVTPTASSINAATGFCGGAQAGSGQCWYDMAVGVDPGNASHVVVGGSAGNNNSSTLWRSTDGGSTWTDITSGATLARPHVDTHAVVIVPGTTTLLTGDDGGIWSTADFTATPPTWSGLNSSLQITQHYSGLSISRTDENLAYAGAQDNGTDKFTGSSAWTNVACGDGGFTAIDAQFDTTVYAACQNNVILKSYQNGAAGTFHGPLSTGIAADRRSFISPFVQDPNNSGWLYDGTYRVYQTQNGGNLWTPISPDLTADGASFVDTIAVAPGAPDVVYAGTGDGQIWRTTNATMGAGAIWTNLTQAPLPHRYITSVWVDDTDPNRAWVAFSGFSGFTDHVGHLFQTTDGGATWTDISCTNVGVCETPNPSDLANIPVNDVKFDSSSGTIYVGTDVGVFSSVVGSNTWSVPFTGLPNVVVLSLNASRRGTIGYAATHGRGTWIVGLPGTPPPGAFLASISPSSASAGAGLFTMTLDGAQFTASSAVTWDGAANGITTSFVSANQLTAQIPAALLTTSGQHSVRVTDPAGNSKQLEFNIMAPSPSLFSISPTTGPVGSAVTNLVATGSGFINGVTQLLFNGIALAGTVTNGGTTLTVTTVPAGDVTASGNVPVDVFNPQPGGGTSGNPQPFNITAASPAITTLSPSTVAANGPGFSLTVNGSNFVSDGFVTVGGTARPVSFVSSSQLLVSVTASDIAFSIPSLPASVPIVVFNPVAGGPSLSSNTVNLTATNTSNPVPTISSLSPSSVAAGSNFTLTVINTDGSYVGNSVVRVNGVSVATTFVDANHLSAAVPSADVATPNPALPITVFNPVPGGGTSTASNLNVTGATPTITSLSPNSAPAGSPGRNMTVSGTGFDSTAVVHWNGSGAGTARTTTFVSSTKVVAAITTADLSANATVPVTVINSTGTSNIVDFTVGTGTAGAAATLAVTGFPSPTTAGASHNVTVTAKDASNNTATSYTGTVHFTSTDGAAVLPANYTFVAGDAGVHTFSVTLNTAPGPQSITATDTVTATITGTQSSITVNAAAASTLSVTAFPSPTTAGVSHNVTVTAKDASNNTVTSYTGTVKFTSSDAAAVLPANYTFVAGDNGTHTFVGGATLKTAGTQSITATDTVTASITGTQSGITVNPAAASTLSVTGFPSPTTAGVSHNVTVTAKDAFSNTATTYTGTVKITSTDVSAVLPANYTFVAGDAGVHNLPVTLNTPPGPQSITATDTVTASITGTQSGITVTAAASNDFTDATSDHKWETVGNWSLGHVPTATETATDTTGKNPTIATAQTVAAVNFANGGTLTIPAGGSLTFAGASTMANLVVNGGTLTANGALTVSGTMTLTAGTVTGLGQISTNGPLIWAGSGSLAGTASPNAAFNANGTVDFNNGNANGSAHFLNQRTFNLPSSGITTLKGPTNSVTLGNGAVFRVPPGGTLTLDLDGGLNNNQGFANNGGAPANTVQNDGTIRKAAGNTGSSFFGVPVNNTGLIEVLSGAISVNSTYTQTGAGAITRLNSANITGGSTLTIDGGALTGVGTITGNVNNASGNVNPGVAPATGTLTISGTYTQGAGGTLNLALGGTGAGQFDVLAVGGAATLGGTLNATLVNGYVPAGTDALTVMTYASDGATDFASKTIPAGMFESTNATNVILHGPQPIANPTPPNIPFGNQSVTSPSATQDVTITNNGQATLNISSIALTGTDASQYILGAPTSGTACNVAGDTVGAGLNCKVGVKFAPTTLGTKNNASVTITDDSGGTAGTQQSVGLTGTGIPGPANTLTVTGFPNPATAGTAGNVTVTAKDALNNTATAYIGTVHFTSTDGAAVLPANYTFVAGDSGTHTFVGGATLNTAGTQSLTATDTVTATITGTQSGITVNASNATTLTVAGFTSPTTAGVSHNVTVTAKDAENNIATGYRGTVHFTSSDPAAVLPADYAFVAADNGVHTFPATLKTAGTQSLTAKDTVTATITGTQSGITVNAAAASTLSVTGFPNPSTAGVAGNFTVTAKDAFNNTATSYTGTVHITSSDGLAVLPADYTFVAGDSGAHTFVGGATLKTVGTQSLTATDTVTASITGTQSGITVNAAGASTLTVSGFPNPATAGTPGNFTVTAKDALNNTATGYTGTVHFTSSDAAAVLPANYTFVPADKGVHQFSATLKTAGTQSLTATDTVTATITGTQAGITVNAGAASTLSVTGFPSPTTAGASHNVTVTAKDASNNAATGYAGTVHFTSSDGAATLPVNYTFVAADNGVHQFPATLNTGGTQSLTATDTVTASITGTQSGITVNNLVPTVTSALTSGANPVNHAPGGATLALTVNGTNFVSTSTVNFNGKAETTTFVTTVKLTANVPATDMTPAGAVNVTVTNPAPGGGTSAPVQFTIDGYTVSGGAQTPSPVTAGKSATFTITVTPSANGFTSAVTFSVSGLPAHTTAMFQPNSVTPNNGVPPAQTQMTITTTARGAAPPSAPSKPPTLPLRLLALGWLAALLAAIYVVQTKRRLPQMRRHFAVASLVLLLFTGAVIAGCSSAVGGTPAGTYPNIQVTAMSGTLSQTTQVTLTVQ